MDQGKSLIVALSQDAALNRPVEAREHVRRMHELFFTLAPDKAAIESNINRAMYLADKSLYSYYRDWNEKGYYNRPADDYPKQQYHRAFPGHPLLPAEYGQVG